MATSSLRGQIAASSQLVYAEGGRPRFSLILLAVCIGVAMLLAILSPTQVLAASAYFGDINGNTEDITVDVEDEFTIVLWAVDVTALAGYDCRITVSGPGTAIGQAAHGDWFADGHTVFDGLTTVPADYNTAMLISPISITGTGEIVAFTIRADDDGVVAVNVDPEHFFLANTSGAKMYLLEPSTLYVTIGTGESMSGGTGGSQDVVSEDQNSSSESMELDDPQVYWLYIDSWRYYSEEQHYDAKDAEIVAVPQNMGGTTPCAHEVEDGTEITLTAPLAYYSYNTLGWSGWLAFHHWRTSLYIGGTTDCTGSA